MVTRPGLGWSLTKTMAEHDHLFGDAKATARTVASDRKLKQLQKAKEAFKENPTDGNQAALATAYFDIGKYDKAESLMRGLLEAENPSQQLLCDLAFTYKNMGQMENAQEVFRRVIEVDPKHPLARCAENELWTIDPSYKPSWLRK